MQRAALLRRTGTHADAKHDGPRISSAPRRKRGALRSIRGTQAYPLHPGNGGLPRHLRAL